MNKLKYSIAALSLFTLVATNAAAQQTADEAATKEKSEATETPKFALSLNAGATFSYTDVKPSKTGITIGVAGAYYATPYLHINLDLQKGWIKGGEKIDVKNVMGSDNSYFAGSVAARFLPFGLAKSNSNGMKFLKGIYGGAGIGLISTSVKANQVIAGEFGALGDYSGMSLMIPIEGGINIPVAELANNKRIMINLNYRVNLCMSDKIDGYVPVVEANKKNDAFNALTAGVVFNF
ncbi:MAG: hypothetical protein EOP49_04785 [Sphingobacteriales bacterium]|nr:MAG: hypothetical protein EOP49_04785 [Sphingobacteriales bacterium]